MIETLARQVDDDQLIVDRTELLFPVNSPALNLIETHAHLDYPDFGNDFEEVLQRATEAGVNRIVTIGTSIESSRQAIALAERHGNVFAVIGVHPTTALEAPEDVITPLRELARSTRVVALGETGLDYHRLPSTAAAIQKKVQVFARALQGETEEEIEAQIEKKDVATKIFTC